MAHDLLIAVHSELAGHKPNLAVGHFSGIAKGRDDDEIERVDHNEKYQNAYPIENDIENQVVPSYLALDGTQAGHINPSYIIA